ncbi:MAG: hypothetical protein AAF141_09040 [Pseudomonadota bacterium]
MGVLSAAAKARLAAQNNADLHAAIFKAHGLRFHRDDVAFFGLDEPPPYYARLVTLDPGASAQQMACLMAASSEHGAIGPVKDSFSQLNAAQLGMEVLFEASWIWRTGDCVKVSPELQMDMGDGQLNGWSKAQTATDLFEWHNAWSCSGSPTSETIFPRACLADRTLIFLARRSAGKIDAGCIANLSDRTIGLSNVFSTQAQDTIFEEAATVVASVAPNRPIVGYESGAHFAMALSAGFEAVGALRVLIRTHAGSEVK